MNALLLAALLTQAPLTEHVPAKIDEVKLRDIRVVQKGEGVPAKGLWMDEETAKDLASETKELRLRPTKMQVVIVAVVAVAAGAAAGVGLSAALARR